MENWTSADVLTLFLFFGHQLNLREKLDTRGLDDPFFFFLVITEFCVENWTSAGVMTFFFALYLILRENLDISALFFCKFVIFLLIAAGQPE